MPIPDFQSVMLPLLQHFSDGKEHPNQETLNSLAEHFKLTDDDLAQLLPSGMQPIFTNRVAWAKSHLKAAGLIESPRRGFYKIRPRGLDVLKTNPKRVDLKLLSQFPEFIEFRTPKSDTGETKSNGTDLQSIRDTDHLTPEDHLEYGYQRIRDKLAADLLTKVKEASPAFFEKLVVELLLAMGYGGSRQDAGRTVGRAGDGGIDGVINEDRLGLDVIYVQAKRWEGTVGRPEIQKFAGALQGQRAKKGIFITTSDFSRDANDYAAMIDSRIVLVTGVRLANLMIEHGIGVTRAASYEVKRLDSDYFEES
jgi:restriction system protein